MANQDNKKNLPNNEKKFSEKFVDAYQASNKSAEQVNKLKNRTVGNNGMSLGTQFKATGNIEIVPNDGNPYIGIEVETLGDNPIKSFVSLQNLMGVSSLNGYIVDKQDTPLIHTTRANAKKDTEPTITEIYPNNEGITEDDLWKDLPTRHLLTLADMISEGTYEIKDKIFTYKGTICRPYKAKKAGSFGKTEYWQAGDARVMIVKIFSVE